MYLHNNIELYLTITAITLSLIGSYFILRKDWKSYGIVYLLSGIVGNILCYIFVKLTFYSFPFRLFPQISIMPFETILTMFPFFVILGIYYSPRSWAYKIPFYWVIVHLGMVSETLAHNLTNLISYNYEWDFWDSYTWWWIFLLLFDYVGGLIVPCHLRKPISQEAFKYGNGGFFILHFVLIVTVFLGGYYVGLKK
ncbi:CBO0543 family protein [Desulforamulus aeronauticus]|uniref:Uncharacterized protein n=1 Tax=Desulforamulus aeronauticus DSM 10349 TaxID=1121421 RepID=A0A1M6QCA0_9FIRM|nr:CBO0543 family protein [Desulforamulus aeronauticus]SHK17872.1 hypothetical protein SAMN02745123_00962 [Desulforamulus aeronauticus DSM 10349]